MKNKAQTTILTEEKVHLEKLHQIVSDAIRAEELIIQMNLKIFSKGCLTVA